MKSIAGRLSSFVAALLLLLVFSVPSQAALVIKLAPTAGTDLSNVHVGDTLQFITIGSSDADPAVDPDEHLMAPAFVHLFANVDDFDMFSGLSVAGWSGVLGTGRSLVLWTVQPNAAGLFELYNGFSDCNGLPSDTTGCAVTNLGATRPADSNRISFTVSDVPEPSSIALLAAGLLALGFRRRM